MDGRTLNGAMSRWEDQRLEFETQSDVAAVTVNEVLRVRFAPPADAPPGPTVELIDGSVVPVEAYTAADGKAHFKLSTSPEPMVVETQLIAAVHLQPPTPSIAAQWAELIEANEAGDLIVIRKEGAVDHLAGRLGDVTDTHVTFFLDDEEFPVERARVDGLVYYHARRREFPDSLCIVRGRKDLSLAVAAATLAEDVLNVQTACGVELAIPMTDVESIDFSAGKLIYLGELAPRTVETTPLVAYPDSAAIAARLGGPIVDRGFFSAEAQLRFPLYRGDRITGWDLKGHARSIGLRSKSQIEYTLPDGFRRLRATAGIDGTLGGRGNVYLAVFGDQRLLWEHTIDGNQPPVPVDLDVEGVRRLKIVVDYGDGGDAADRLYLCDARITK
jgi:hypothetical protein